MTGCNAYYALIFLCIGIQVHKISGQGIIIVNPTSAPAIVTPTCVTCACQCTPASNCADAGGSLDPRVLNSNNPPFTGCAPPNRMCCNIINPNIVVPIIGPQTCGTQPFIPFPGYLPTSGQANFAEYPWMAVVLGTDNSYIGGGVLLDATTVLTIAHKVTPLSVGLIVRLGEYILNSNSAPRRAVIIPVTAIRIHPQYNSVNLQNDIAILKLANPVDFSANPHVVPICLPTAGAVYTGQRCYVSGFGTSSFVNGAYSTTMREVDVPVLDPTTCQTALQNTRLGFSFTLNSQTFLCAGGEPGKDACTGDGGSPLVCQSGSQWYLAGLVSWGIGCGFPTVPGVYTNIPQYISWIAANRF